MSTHMPIHPIQIYAELLPNIRQVSVSVSFDSPVEGTSTAVEVLQEEDGVNGDKRVKSGEGRRGTTRLRVRHGSDVREMLLPGRVAGSSGARLPLPTASQQQQGLAAPSNLTWRLPLGGDGPPPGRDPSGADDMLTPWPAPDLLPMSKVVCRSCDAVVVPQDTIAAWKDLPSENWAEMMEFWHCHKPDRHDHDHDHGPDASATGSAKASEADLAHRGYGANSVISAEPGIGFVDLITLLFSESDCQGLLFSASTVEKASASREAAAAGATPAAADSRGLNVFCACCRAQIGYFGFRMQSVSLFQWQVGCVSTATAAAPSISHCVAATLVATISRTGSSKSVVLPIYEAPEAVDGGLRGAKVLQLWVLNSNIWYASSRRETDKPTLAIKLLYRYIDRKDADDLLGKLSSDVQEINLPGETIQAVAAQLEESNELLPSRDRAFKEWRIGLVERWNPSR